MVHTQQQFGRQPGRGRQRGFTIIELLVVVVIVAIVFTIAAPSVRLMMARNQVRTVSADLLSDIALSRSEASKRSQRVVMCPSSDQSGCSGSSNWGVGWIAFVDVDANGSRNTGTEPLLRVHDPIPTGVTIGSGGISSLSFRAIGVVSSAATFDVCPATAGSGATGRQITMSIVGRIQALDAPSGTCP